MSLRATLIGAALLLVAGTGLGWWLRGVGSHKAQQAALAQAARIDATATAALNQGVQDAQAARVQGQAVQAADTQVAQDRARLQVDQAARAARAVRPAASGALDPGAAPAPVDQVDADKDRLINDQAVEITALKGQVANLEASNSAYQQAAQGYQQEAAGLCTALAVQPPEHHWAAGPVAGTGRALGVALERDLGPVRAGVAAVRQVLPNGSVNVNALGWALVRF